LWWVVLGRRATRGYSSLDEKKKWKEEIASGRRGKHWPDLERTRNERIKCRGEEPKGSN
jgi:hypothetical protein